MSDILLGSLLELRLVTTSDGIFLLTLEYSSKFSITILIRAFRLLLFFNLVSDVFILAFKNSEDLLS